MYDSGQQHISVSSPYVEVLLLKLQLDGNHLSSPDVTVVVKRHKLECWRAGN